MILRKYLNRKLHRLKSIISLSLHITHLPSPLTLQDPSSNPYIPLERNPRRTLIDPLKGSTKSLDPKP